MRIVKKVNLEELLEKGVIDSTTAGKIWTYYRQKEEEAPNRLGLILSILGASLVGLGIILIVAHNWDNLGRTLKTVLAFIPLLIGQGACWYALRNQSESTAWREGAATFLFFAVGICIAMISQIYNIQGELGSFLLTWMLLVFPLIYLMPSSVVALLYTGGVTWYGTNCGYVNGHEPYLYWGLLAAVLPFYYQLLKNRPESNSFNYLSWAIALSVLVCLGLWSDEADNLMWIAYVALLSIYFLIGIGPRFRHKRSVSNPFLLIGLLGTIALFLGFTFYDCWEEIVRNRIPFSSIFRQPEFWVATLLTLGSINLLGQRRPWENFLAISPVPLSILLFIPLYLTGGYAPGISMIISNLFVLGVGIFYIYLGNEYQRLSLLNLGLLTITALIICRFFDMEWSFVVRGVVFVLLGISFFIANYQLLKRKRGKTG